MKNEYLLPEITSISKPPPMLVHLAQATPKAGKHKLSNHNWPEGQAQ